MKDYFYGWYMKCQSDTQTLGVIPAVHRSGGKRTCSIQVITDDGAWTVTFPGDAYCRPGKRPAIGKNGFCGNGMGLAIGKNGFRGNGMGLTIGKNRFSSRGMRLEIQTRELTVKGKLRFGPLTPLKYDIMGPFALLPWMECRHMVWSMQHLVSGTVYVNGKKYRFLNDCGYWEGDRGRSFPKEYLWTQCCFPGGSLMLSVADIPIMGMRFTGVIGVVLWQGKEYRLATYLGARVRHDRNQKVHVLQGKLELEAELLEGTGQPLKAPSKGDMVRTIHESAACRARYRFRVDGRTLFAFETDHASFEYEYPGGDGSSDRCGRNRRLPD